MVLYEEYSKMIKERRAQYRYLVTIAIVLAGFLVLAAFTTIFGAEVTKKGDIEVCRLSVLTQAQTKTFGQTHTSLKCPRRQVKFFNSKVEINGKKESKYEFSELDDEAVNKVIAEELRICWGMMGEGDLDVFRQPIITLTSLEAGKTVCTICSEISFDKRIEKDRFVGLLNYLKGTKIPERGIYYFDYLVKAQRDQYLGNWDRIPFAQYTPWGWGTTSKIEEDFFQADRDYTIYFLGWKPDWLDDKVRAYTSAYYIGLGTPGKAAEECYRLVN